MTLNLLAQKVGWIHSSEEGIDNTADLYIDYFLLSVSSTSSSNLLSHLPSTNLRSLQNNHQRYLVSRR